MIGVLADVFNVRPDSIVPGLTKDDVGSWDSLKQMDLVTSIEREYSVTLDIPDIIRMVSVAEIVAVLGEKGVEIEFN